MNTDIKAKLADRLRGIAQELDQMARSGEPVRPHRLTFLAARLDLLAVDIGRCEHTLDEIVADAWEQDAIARRQAVVDAIRAAALGVTRPGDAA